MGVLYVRGLEFGWFLTKPLIRPRSLVRVHPGMVVKQVFDLSLRESGKRFIISLKASSRYSDGYLVSCI